MSVPARPGRSRHRQSPCPECDTVERQMPHPCRAALPVIASRRETSSLVSDAAAVGTRDRTRWYQLGLSAAAHFLHLLVCPPHLCSSCLPVSTSIFSFCGKKKSVCASEYPWAVFVHDCKSHWFNFLNCFWSMLIYRSSFVQVELLQWNYWWNENNFELLSNFFTK